MSIEVRTIGEFNPDYKVHPGDLLEEELISKGFTQSDLAKRTGLTTKTINTIINGLASITPDTAVLFETVLGKPAEYWLKLETDYQITKINEIQHKFLQEDIKLLEDIDLDGVIKKGWLPKFTDKVEQLLAVLSFLGVSSKNQLSLVWSNLDVNYRTNETYKKNHYNIMLWLRQGELEAQKITCEPFNDKLFKDALSKCREFTNTPFNEIRKDVQAICADAGVAVVFVPELKNVSTSGAAQWLSKDKALIQLSDRGKREDVFWFNFFHEASHIILHGRKEQFIDGKNISLTSERALKEAEADESAANLLVPRKDFTMFVSMNDFSEQSIKSFSKKLGIHPGIVVGQLQKRDYLSWGTLSELRRPFKF